MHFHLNDCCAVITGASSGLGAEFARQLAPHARTLVVAARRTEVLQAGAAEAAKVNPKLRVLTVTCDLATAAGRDLLLEHIDINDIRPNLLINNAGMGDYGTFESADEARLAAQINLNITALVMLTHAMIPRMAAGTDHPAGIINVGSLASTLPLPDLAVYAATKAFVASFTEALAVELADKNIIVSGVHPGPTPTQFSQTARRESGADVDRGGQGLLRIPPHEVVAAALKGLQTACPSVYPGLGVSIAARAFRLMPRALQRVILRRRFAARPASHA